MASHLRVVAKQWWRVAILQRWVTTHLHQRSTQRIHYKSRRISCAWIRTRFTWRKFRLQSVPPKVLDQCQRVVLRPSGKYDQESVNVLPVRGGERVQVVRLYLWRQRKNRSCHSISLLSAQFSGMITSQPQTQCVQFYYKSGQLKYNYYSNCKANIGTKRHWGINVK